MSDTAPSHQLSLCKPYLKLIADGIKTVEVRVGYPKMRRIQAGHELAFASGGDTVVTRVKRVAQYDSFEALLDHEDAVAIRGVDRPGRSRRVTAP